MVENLSRLRVVAGLVVALAATSFGTLARPAPVAAAECGIPTCELTVDAIGDGSGRIKTTNSAGVPNGFLDCEIVNGNKVPTSVCSHVYGVEDRASPLVIYYTFYPAPGSRGCIGATACSTTPLSTQFTMTSNKTIDGRFFLLIYDVIVAKSGTAAATGTIGSTPLGIFCGAQCDSAFTYGTALNLSALAGANSYFAGWTGACAGQPASCQLTVTGPIDTTAIFTAGSPPTASPPAPTPTATAKATAKPTTTLRPGDQTPSPVPTAGPGTPDPGQTGASESDGPDTAAPGSPLAPGSLGPTPAPTEAPVTSVIGSSTDLTPIALAILGAGLLIAIGIGGAAYFMRRRPAPPA